MLTCAPSSRLCGPSSRNKTFSNPPQAQSRSVGTHSLSEAQYGRCEAGNFSPSRTLGFLSGVRDNPEGIRIRRAAPLSVLDCHVQPTTILYSHLFGFSDSRCFLYTLDSRPYPRFWFFPPKARVNCEAVRDNHEVVRNNSAGVRINPEGIRVPAAKQLSRCARHDIQL
ncbi:hypothetical protein Kole_1243 [Kosmotoga olearia TBF 19.5.1]|uniref:Uncharacterized protein n=1 Tax=Kosmotoga olearia (strain ATCC BAA-1733 / DSM 21960 / TBF 19.5.1) TaxID=521045 RepID=C5CJ24_KOSOT|nr:hypothetical protein Kole_1243 [Kosmotoga olearia TBF 19.5.1]